MTKVKTETPNLVPERASTSIAVEPKLWREFKSAMVLRGVNYSVGLENLIRLFLENPDQPFGSNEPRLLPFGLFRAENAEYHQMLEHILNGSNEATHIAIMANLDAFYHTNLVSGRQTIDDVRRSTREALKKGEREPAATSSDGTQPESSKKKKRLTGNRNPRIIS